MICSEKLGQQISVLTRLDHTDRIIYDFFAATSARMLVSKVYETTPYLPQSAGGSMPPYIQCRFNGHIGDVD